MSAEQDKASAFVARLLNNPALQSLTPLQREEQIIQFLHANAAQLAPTLASPSFFNGRSWNQIVALLLQALMNAVDAQLMPDLANLVSGVRMGFVNVLRPQSVSEEKVRSEILEMLRSLLGRIEARRTFTGAHAALVYGFPDRYVNEIWNRRNSGKSYIHFQLTKVQRLKLGRDDVKSLLEVTLLLKPLVHLVTTGSAPAVGEQTSGTVQNAYAEKVIAAARRQLPSLPDHAIKSAVNANVSFLENRFIEATARVAAVLAARCRNYQPNVRVDRGADTPDKSWLSIARRNYKFYGFDDKILDELYSIAAENGW